MFVCDGDIWLQLLKLAFKYIWTNHLSKNKKGCALVGTKTSINNS